VPFATSQMRTTVSSEPAATKHASGEIATLVLLASSFRSSSIGSTFDSRVFMSHIRAVLSPEPETMSEPSEVERVDFLLVAFERIPDAFAGDVPYLCERKWKEATRNGRKWRPTWRGTFHPDRSIPCRCAGRVQLNVPMCILQSEMDVCLPMVRGLSRGLVRGGSTTRTSIRPARDPDLHRQCEGCCPDRWQKSSMARATSYEHGTRARPGDRSTRHTTLSSPRRARAPRSYTTVHASTHRVRRPPARRGPRLVRDCVSRTTGGRRGT
jgi:hypothetical protein